ncbi:hypothetical protein [Methanobrevibacter sp. DSM 116169]|uniref:hypothetical protein n=1 Tax=Methanobrevibacter sp. DSM 116169 TaxID=3242727 RepID=UPI0038FBEFB9
MKNKFSSEISNYFRQIKGNVYKKIKVDSKNFYYIYKMEIIAIKKSPSTLQLDPLCLIIEDNGKFHLYALNESKYFDENKKEIIRDFIKDLYLGNGMFSDSTIISIK